MGTAARGHAKLLSLLAAFVWLAFSSTAAAGGMLTAIDAQGQERGTFPLTRTDVRAEVAGPLASVEVTQHFTNPYSEAIEAVYTFPLPNRGAVDDMEMRIADRVVRGVIRPREEARQVYNAARVQGRRAALLEQERPNIFTMSVANIGPGHEIVVRIHYFERVAYERGTYELSVPTVVGPRYMPGHIPGGAQSGTGAHPDTDRVRDASRISPAYAHPGVTGHALTIDARINAGAPIAMLQSSTHALDVQNETASVARVALRNGAEVPNRDFVLRWTLTAPDVQAAVFTHHAASAAHGYLALALEPRHAIPDNEFAAREIFFLLDTSGSMMGAPIQAALAAVRRAVTGLHPSDTFQIIDFADTASSFAPAPLANTPANVQRALQYISDIHPGGGTNQLAGIHAALSQRGDPMRVRHVVFMTDGYIGNEAEVLALVHREIGNSRIFGFGIGASVNRYLLDEVSHVGRGVSEYLLPGEEPNAMITRFYERISQPYLTDIQIDWGGLDVDEMTPTPVRDLSALEPLVVYARYAGAGQGNVTVRGRAAGRPFERVIPIVLPALQDANSAISRLFGRERVADLTRMGHFDGDNRAREITLLGVEHHLVTQFTSIVAVDEVVSPGTPATPPRQVIQPSEAPAGVDLRAAGGRVIASPIVPPIYAGRDGEGDVRIGGREQGNVSVDGRAAPPGMVGNMGVGGGSYSVNMPRSVEPQLAPSPGAGGGRASRGACASCAVGGARTERGWMALGLLGIALGIVARRRRTRSRR